MEEPRRGPGEDGMWLAELHGRDPVADADVDVGGITLRDWAAYHARPQADPAGTEWLPGLVYGLGGEGRELRLWGYRSVGGAPRPGVVFVHGGGWTGGHPFMHLRHCWALAERGWVTATIEYRRWPEATWPGALEDAKCAMRWMRANADWLGLDAGRLAVSGGSAGGHLAAMVALTPGLFEGTGGSGDESSAADAAALWYPITDMHCPGVPDLRAAAVNFLGTDDEAVTVEASPMTYAAQQTTPPILTITGSADGVVPLDGVRAFHDVLARAGTVNRLHVVPDAIHGWDFAPEPWEHCFAVLTDFLDATPRQLHIWRT